MPGIGIERVEAPTPEAVALLGELDAVLNAAYAPEQRHGLTLDALFRPNIRFFVARFDGEPAGCGGVALFGEFAEVKRMYSRQTMRGQGIGKAILARLQHEARDAGHRILRVETGIHQTAAIGFYEGSGFMRRGPFGDYAALPPHRIAASIFYEMPL